MLLHEAERHADDVARQLAPACEAIVVCGSIRRRKPEVKDIELVALPRPGATRPVFGDPASALPPLDALLARLVAWGELARNTANPKWGARYKALLHPRGRIGIDLFVAAPGNLGDTLAIRTGDSDFTRLLFTPRTTGGLLPEGLRHEGGYLWRGEERLACPDEPAFFAALGLPLVPPEERSVATVARLRRELRREEVAA